MTHSSSGGSGLASDETHDGQVAVIVLREPFSSLLFSLSSDLSNHDYSLGFGVTHKLLENIDEVGSVEGITSNSHDGGLTETHMGGLVNSLIGEGS
jgi:hypothetical protein